MIKLLSLLYKGKVFVVAALLTLVLSSMVYSRVSILKSGREIVLLSRPVDPRDLFRGHYTIMNYKDISQLEGCKVEIPQNLRRHQPIFVQLEESDNGYWKAVSVSDRPLVSSATTVILSGYAINSYQNKKTAGKKKCPNLYVKYGLEKYFAPKKRAQDLEKMRRGINLQSQKQVAALRKKVRANAKRRNELWSQQYKQNGNRYTPEKIPNAEMEQLSKETDILIQKIRAIEDEARAEIAVIVRVSQSGIGVISGLMIDGKKVYDEPLW